MLEIVSLHPATAKHVATKLCRRFIADAPPAAAVEAVADAFVRTGGDIGDTLRALFGTEAFRASRGVKFKKPLHFIVSALRATGAKAEHATALTEYLVRMGHAPFHYPTPDGYPEEATPWMGTLLWRWNFAVSMLDKKIGGIEYDAAQVAKWFPRGEDLAAHFLGRRATADEAAVFESAQPPVALLLASPGFQRC